MAIQEQRGILFSSGVRDPSNMDSEEDEDDSTRAVFEQNDPNRNVIVDQLEQKRRLAVIKTSTRDWWNRYINDHRSNHLLTINTIVTTLNTLWIMDLKSEFQRGREQIESYDFGEKQSNLTLNRMLLESLLSTYALTNDQMFLTKAYQIVQTNRLDSSIRTSRRTPRLYDLLPFLYLSMLNASETNRSTIIHKYSVQIANSYRRTLLKNKIDRITSMDDTIDLIKFYYLLMPSERDKDHDYHQYNKTLHIWARSLGECVYKYRQHNSNSTCNQYQSSLSESYFIGYRMTGDSRYHHYGWQLFQTLSYCFPHKSFDKLMKTLKYIYLTYHPILPIDQSRSISLNRWIFTNTGQPLPIIEYIRNEY
ncbi:Endoplasmic reticulum mannosyl-oligosaccharide 1,2-alpha-mannosidase [Blomia tropicalis]|nr:Endoplasmic reticulum mannosyl-oligosaccharide 1,2-alpha-mannosidase [Blomia tropicalis]